MAVAARPATFHPMPRDRGAALLRLVADSNRITGVVEGDVSAAKRKGTIPWLV
jgi:hypothetical protein